MAEYVFGYGSLAHDGVTSVPSIVVHAAGLRRAWTVAMDNRATLPGYKYYVDAITGARPAVQVTFVDLVDAAATVNGVLLGPVGPDRLAALDERERNYARVELSDRIVEPVDGVVWAYRGTEAARRRFADGLSAGTAVLDSRYRDAVHAGFRALGPLAYAEFLASTDPPDCPARALRRIDLQ